MNVIDTEMEGLKIVELNKTFDVRGNFIKVFNSDIISELGMEIDVEECYYTVSRKNVIRGMHFQSPPFDHSKLVHVLCGNVVDVVLDLRKNSKTYLKYADFHLSGDKPKALYIPKGFAHGFASLADNSMMLYMVSTGYHPENDMGILFDSFGYEWKIRDPILSDRDLKFVGLESFTSPF